MPRSHLTGFRLYYTKHQGFCFYFLLLMIKKQTQKHDFAQHGLTPVRDTCPVSSVSSTRQSGSIAFDETTLTFSTMPDLKEMLQMYLSPVGNYIPERWARAVHALGLASQGSH